MVKNEPHDFLHSSHSAPRNALEFVLQNKKYPPEKAENDEILFKTNSSIEPDDRNGKCKSPMRSEAATMFLVANSDQDADERNELEQNVQNSFYRIFRNLQI